MNVTLKRLGHELVARGTTLFICSPRGEWADPGGTAIPGQPVAKVEQAPYTSPKSKNQFNIEDVQWTSYQILS